MILALALTVLGWTSHPHYHSQFRHQYNARPYAEHHRSLAVKHEFWRRSGHPHGWPNHVVDHVVPLACGGEDTLANMAWQSTAEAKAKDAWERKDCSIYGGRTRP
jgi:hypothetical protein